MSLPNIPLAERIRPKTFEDYIGQEHLVGKNGIIKLALKTNALPSMIFWGSPGIGKTTLAGLISEQFNRPFHTLSAISSGVKDVREVLLQAEKQNLFTSAQPILFIDEIHRFSKSQQDSLLGAVEKGTVTLIGATTENPSFEVISALLSRCQVYTLNPLDKDQLLKLIDNAIKKDEVLKQKEIEIKESDALIRFSGGDARKLLNALDLVVAQANTKKVVITNESVTNIIKNNLSNYDKNGENHYDIISAFIKSIRGSDPNAAVYWLARMIEGGEDPKFIARRLIISASEDIGNANPTALVIANTCFQSVSIIGYPECRIVLSQATVYLACSAKSNASYMAINDAQQLVKSTGDLPIPLHLRNAPTKLMKQLDYGKNYEYSHSQNNSFSAQEYLPEDVKNTTLFDPKNNPRENEMRTKLKSLWNKKYGY